MSIINVGGLSVSETSYRRARQIVEEKQEGGRRTAPDVLYSLQRMMPGWNISTSAADWGEGFRNIAIDARTLQRMAEDPEALVRYKALILDLEEAVPALEEWAQENESAGKTLEFGIMLNQDGGNRAMALMRTLLGETRTTFELPDDRPTWASLIQQKLDALREGQAEEADGSRSWVG